jgi:hypothetical protein
MEIILAALRQQRKMTNFMSFRVRRMTAAADAVREPASRFANALDLAARP